jgi:hypothetical protein
MLTGWTDMDDRAKDEGWKVITFTANLRRRDADATAKVCEPLVEATGGSVAEYDRIHNLLRGTFWRVR